MEKRMPQRKKGSSPDERFLLMLGKLVNSLAEEHILLILLTNTIQYIVKDIYNRINTSCHILYDMAEYR